MHPTIAGRSRLHRLQPDGTTSAGDPIPGATVRVLDFTPAATAGRWIPDEYPVAFDARDDGDVAAASTVCDRNSADNGHRRTAAPIDQMNAPAPSPCP